MKLGRVTATGPDGPDTRLVGVLPDEGVVVDLAVAERVRLTRAGADPVAARRIAAALFPPSMAAAIGGGPAFTDAAGRALAEPPDEAVSKLDAVTWATPIDPLVVRDCSAFERHLLNAHARGKKPVPEEFYRAPVYYKMSPATLIPGGTEVPWPFGCRFMDYELEVGLVIGRPALNVRPEDARELLFGVTVMNDFSARDLQAREMSAGLGPAKGKDFATAIGPWITTIDELDPDDLEMIARVNGEEWSRGSTASMMWSIDEIIAYASTTETLTTGELIGTGTVGSGSGLELYKKLRPGDVVELEVAGIGSIANPIGHPPEDGWRPSPKTPSEGNGG
jgi:2-keto-4-pentenoate hydratase/2-oxohepta-3-ene-1,7-dioic acid hydratase in catechol pathway